MRDNYIIKPDMGVLLNYFSADLPNFLSLPKSSLWESLKNICRDGNASFETFYLFGAFDILNLGISNDIKKLDDMHKIKSHQEIEGVMDYFIHYGMVVSLYPEPFDLKNAVKQNPLIGVITVKIKNSAWDEIYEKFNNVDILTKKISELFKLSIEKTKNDCNELNTNNYKSLLALSYDCEDLIIIFFANSFQFIKQFTTNLRTLELNDIYPDSSSKNKKYIIASTNTILGMYLQKHDKNTLKVPIPIDNNFDEINWYTLFEVHPGYLQYAKNAISRLAKKNEIELQITPLVGRNDLIVNPVSTSKLQLETFLETHIHLINGLSENLSIESTETYISFPKIDKVESKRKPIKLTSDIQTVSEKLTEQIDRIDKSHLNKLEKESFVQIVRKLKYLLEDKYLQDSFITLYPVVTRAIDEYLNLDDIHNKGASLEMLTAFIELCYATRYQGSPPIGETAVYPTLGYYSLGQKSLILLDYLGNWIITSFAEELTVKKFFPQYIASININCPVGICIPINGIGLSFIFLPPRPIFHPEILLVNYFHELGHVIFKCFITGDEVKDHFININQSKVKHLKVKHLEDLIAEFFSSKMLFNLDFDNHNETMKSCLDSFEFKNERKITIEKIKNIHIDGARDLVNKIKNKKIFMGFLGKFKITDVTFCNRLFDFLNFVAEWKADEIIKEVRKFLSSPQKQKEFWNLWILLNSKRGDCYYPLPVRAYKKTKLRTPSVTS